MKLKVHATYTIETDYTFNIDEYINDYPEEAAEKPIEAWAAGWIQEDCNKIDTRVDNVLPQNYKTALHLTYSKGE